MSNLAFDAHKFVKDMTKANMPEDQAAALAQHYANLLDDRLATKDDLKLLKGDLALLRSDLEKLETELKAEISTLRKDMVHLEERVDARFTSLEKRMNARFTNLEERLNARITNVALKTQLAGVVIICAVMGVMFNFFLTQALMSLS